MGVLGSEKNRGREAKPSGGRGRKPQRGTETDNSSPRASPSVLKKVALLSAPHQEQHPSLQPVVSPRTIRSEILVLGPPAYMASAAAPAAAAGAGRRIVVAVDEGEESAHALAWCLANVVSPAGGDTLVLVHARRPRPVYAAMDSAGYMMTSDVLASVERHASAISAAAVDKARRLCAEHPHVTVETLVESGDPRDVICDAADKVGADLLVMGSHGYGFIQRAFLGSVSNHCAQNCKCPVLIVKRPKE
ncbi:hypothetical protein GQ55_5G397400 [Panicum hallii var. hallii]|uniref:UspA domain-containing protein n=1 Tax=Panicum hallii var. hallii TaxID=1504633 RepID=A0A2T7DN98_9POAL|nr:hypothetical protein GQ55_5G397400 [Panicum hallii var. hallii]